MDYNCDYVLLVSRIEDKLSWSLTNGDLVMIRNFCEVEGLEIEELFFRC